MVKDCYASVTISAMLSSIVYMCFTYLAKEIEFCVNNFFSIILRRKIYPYFLRFFSYSTFGSVGSIIVQIAPIMPIIIRKAKFIEIPIANTMLLSEISIIVKVTKIKQNP